MTWSGFVFTVAFCSVIYFLRGAIRAWRSPEFRQDLERLREMRRIRKAARRS